MFSRELPNLLVRFQQLCGRHIKRQTPHFVIQNTKVESKPSISRITGDENRLQIWPQKAENHSSSRAGVHSSKAIVADAPPPKEKNICPLLSAALISRG